ncbi:MAG: VCBS repeat-containing protein [Planctomycetes bacterium]|nr:VCBS repeat-containing protein [Planctomycetota bacterium]
MGIWMDVGLVDETFGQFHIFLNDGQTVFKSFGTLNTGRVVVASDFDGDGLLDLASTQSGSQLLIHKNTGQARFKEVKLLDLKKGIRDYNPLDIDGDGDMDLVATGEAAIFVLKNQGGFDFSPGSRYAVNSGSLLTGDIDANGHVDFIHLGLFFNDLTFFWNEGLEGFAGIRSYYTGTRAALMIAEDIDGDGASDLFLSSHFGPVLFLHNDGHGGLAPPVKLTGNEAGPRIADLESSDLDGDNQPELLYLKDSPMEVVILSRWQEGVFSGEKRMPVDSYSLAMTVGDLDSDGYLDLLMPSSTGISWFRNGGAGDFFLSQTLLSLADVNDVVISDLNGDGRKDLAIAGSSGNVSIAFNRGESGFSPAVEIPVEASLVKIAAADLDGDDDLDLLALDFSGRLSVLRNRGGQFDVKIKGFLFGDNVRELAVADLDGDGDMDIAGVSAGANLLTILRNDGSGSFERPLDVLTTSHSQALAVADLNLDSRLDIAVGGEDSLDVAVILNRSGPRSQDLNHNQIPDECERKPFIRGDANADGEIDIADAIFNLEFQFLGRKAPSCLRSADVDDDGSVRANDAVHLLDIIFKGESAPGVLPQICRIDLTPDLLTCDDYRACHGGF